VWKGKEIIYSSLESFPMAMFPKFPVFIFAVAAQCMKEKDVRFCLPVIYYSVQATCFLFVGLRDRRLGILGYQKKTKIEISISEIKYPLINLFHFKMQHNRLQMP
jgi:hypothetical protein